MPVAFLLAFLQGNAQILDEAGKAIREGRAAAVAPLLEGLRYLEPPDRSRLATLVCETMPSALGMDARPAILEAVRVALRKAPSGGEGANLRIAEARILEVLGRHAEALAALDAAISGAEGPVRDALARMRGGLALVGKKAPPLAPEGVLGGFSGLAKWRGKVVVLDFFAHWCKPCAAAFPELKSLYREGHGQGLELLGVTRYYGYYGPRKGLAKAEELRAMAGYRREKGLPWPVALVPPSVEEAYRVMALPTTVVLDRRGTVRSVGFGYYPAEFGALRTLVQRLLSEK